MNAPASSFRPAGRHLPSWLLFLVVTMVVLAADLIIKAAAFEHVAGVPVHLTRDNATLPGAIPPHQEITLVPMLLSLKLVLNTGAVFGMGKGSQWLFMLVSAVAIVVIGRVFWSSRANARGTHLALALILAGALGNLYDRICFAAVRDMFWLFPGVNLPFDWTWPGGRRELYPWIFNLADVSLLTGVGIMLLVLWRGPQPEPAAEKSPG